MLIFEFQTWIPMNINEITWPLGGANRLFQSHAHHLQKRNSSAKHFWSMTISNGLWFNCDFAKYSWVSQIMLSIRTFTANQKALCSWLVSKNSYEAQDVWHLTQTQTLVVEILIILKSIITITITQLQLITSVILPKIKSL